MEPTPTIQAQYRDLPSGTVTFLFTDIEGSTKLAQQYADEMPALLARHHAILNQAIAAHDGFTFQIVGDSYAVAFHNATDALNAALDSQRGLFQEPWSPAPIKVRMGIHTGTAQVQPVGTIPRYDAYATIALSQRIMSAGHGGQILLSQASTALVGDKLPTGVRLVDMRERRLKDIAHPVHIYQASAPDLPAEFAPLTTAEQVNHNLPSELTPFIGRELELTALETLLGDASRTQFANRLVTIVAQGGMGKTRLALQVATRLVPRFPQGLYLVELDRISSPDMLAQSVAQVLPISLLSSEDPQTRVLDYLRDKAVLLVMDNFEHLLIHQDRGKLSNNFEQILEGVAFVQAILSAAPRVQILATSRVRLDLTSETVFNISGLTIGAPGVEQNSAIQLFAQSARRTRPTFELDASTLPAVTRICRLVEGMPLAIVLAAAWINTLTVEEICDEIEKSIDMLETEQRDVPSRQRSVRAVIDSSWNQIDAIAQNQIERLSVFRGGFTRAAAQEVAGAALRSLAHLVDKALLRRDPDTGRYSMHELLRQYGEEQLKHSAARDASAHEAHAIFFAEFMKLRWNDLRGGRQIAALGEIEADLDNIRIAWDYWIAKQDTRRVLEFINPLWMYFEIHSSLIPAIQLFGGAAQKLESSQPEIVCLRAQLRARQAWFTAVLGQPQLGLPLALECVSILRQYNQELDAQILICVCVNATYLNKTQEYDAAAEEMVALAAKRADTFEQVYAHVWWSYGILRQGQLDRAVREAEKWLAISTELDNPFALAWYLSFLGVIALAQGDNRGAKTHYLRAIQQAERIHFKRMILICSELLCTLALNDNDIEQAEEFSLAYLRISREGGQAREQLAALRDLARVYLAQGNLAQALELLPVVLNHPISEQNSMNHPIPLRVEAEAMRAQIESQLDPALYQMAWDAGQRQQLAEVVAQALDHRDVVSPVTAIPN